MILLDVDLHPGSVITIVIVAAPERRRCSLFLVNCVRQLANELAVVTSSVLFLLSGDYILVFLVESIVLVVIEYIHHLFSKRNVEQDLLASVVIGSALSVAPVPDHDWSITKDVALVSSIVPVLQASK